MFNDLFVSRQFLLFVRYPTFLELSFRLFFRESASSLEALRLAFLDSFRLLTASAHFLCSILYFSSAKGVWYLQMHNNTGATILPIPNAISIVCRRRTVGRVRAVLIEMLTNDE